MHTEDRAVSPHERCRPCWRPYRHPCLAADLFSGSLDARAYRSSEEPVRFDVFTLGLEQQARLPFKTVDQLAIKRADKNLRWCSSAWPIPPVSLTRWREAGETQEDGEEEEASDEDGFAALQKLPEFHSKPSSHNKSKTKPLHMYARKSGSGHSLTSARSVSEAFEAFREMLAARAQARESYHTSSDEDVPPRRRVPSTSTTKGLKSKGNPVMDQDLAGRRGLAVGPLVDFARNGRTTHLQLEAMQTVARAAAGKNALADARSSEAGHKHNSPRKRKAMRSDRDTANANPPPYKHYKYINPFPVSRQPKAAVTRAELPAPSSSAHDIGEEPTEIIEDFSETAIRVEVEDSVHEVSFNNDNFDPHEHVLPTPDLFNEAIPGHESPFNILGNSIDVPQHVHSPPMRATGLQASPQSLMMPSILDLSHTSTTSARPSRASIRKTVSFALDSTDHRVASPSEVPNITVTLPTSPAFPAPGTHTKPDESNVTSASPLSIRGKPRQPKEALKSFIKKVRPIMLECPPHIPSNIPFRRLNAPIPPCAIAHVYVTPVSLEQGGLFGEGYLGAGRRGFWALPLSVPARSAETNDARPSSGVVSGASPIDIKDSEVHHNTHAQDIIWTVERVKLLHKQIKQIADLGKLGFLDVYVATDGKRRFDHAEIRVASASTSALPVRTLLGEWACKLVKFQSQGAQGISLQELDELASQDDAKNGMEGPRWLSAASGIRLVWWDEMDRRRILLA